MEWQNNQQLRNNYQVSAIKLTHSGHIVIYAPGVSECSQQRGNLKDNGYSS
ncbi:hypothetical protein [Photorhabdus sp. RM96S]|uniref:hypothetical protein n=1 Tax=Photorhabdus sp. RM96S TaxID=3342822 RepID=UPI0036DB87E8